EPARPAGHGSPLHCYAPGLSVSCLGGLTLPATWTGRPRGGALPRYDPEGSLAEWVIRRKAHASASWSPTGETGPMGPAAPRPAPAHGRTVSGHLRCNADHGPAADPQLLDHRPHRPREVDARRPHPRAHPHG